MSVPGLPDPLGLFGPKTNLLGKPQDSGLDKPIPMIADLETAPVMPTPDDEDVRRKRRRSVSEQRARSGRASTIFTEGYGLGG